MEVSAFTHAGGGIALTDIMFSEEGGKTSHFHCFHGLKHDVFTVPSVEPEPSLSERTPLRNHHATLCLRLGHNICGNYPLFTYSTGMTAVEGMRRESGLTLARTLVCYSSGKGQRESKKT